MNTSELIEWLDYMNEKGGVNGKAKNAADMLRRQHEAIVNLREALAVS